MKWKKRALKFVFITFLISTGLISLSQNICAEQLEAIKLAGIESVVATGDGSATELSIKLTSPATYTSYKTASPLRLVIDLSQVSQGSISEPVIINKGNFKTVTASRFDTDAGVLTRLEIGLINDSEAVITTLPSNPSEIKISFPGLEHSNTSPLNESSSKPLEVDVTQTIASDSFSADKSIALSTLTAISVDNNAIILAIDNVINDFKTFRLNKPERFIVDLMNVKSGLSSKLIPLNASGIASARIGLYPDKVRVVFDAVNGIFPEAKVVKTNKGVVITLDSKLVDENSQTKLIAARSDNTLEEKSPSKPKTASPDSTKVDDNLSVKPNTQPVTKPETEMKLVSGKHDFAGTEKSKLSSGTSSIDMIDFQVIEGISRVSVKIIGDVKVEQPAKTSGYVTLTIKNTLLPKKLQRSMETRSFISPVLRITPLTIKTKKSTDTKIRIALRVAAPFEFRQEGDMLYVDFKHPEGLSGDKLVIEAAEQKSNKARQKTAPMAEDEMPADLAPMIESTSKPLSSSRGYKGRKVTLEFADAEVRKIFQLLSEVSNKNFVLGDEVTGAISLKLVNVPWDQALDIILETKGLDKREDGNIILIKGKGKFKSQAEEDLEIKKTAAKSIELKTETFSVNYANISEITTQFEKLKTPDRGQISSDSRTNKVIVKDTPQALDEMRKLLIQLDISERQVLIEARIVIATSSFSQQLGVQWGTHYRDGSASHFGINSIDSSFGGLVSAPSTSGFASAAGMSTGISFGTLASNVQLDMRLRAAASMDNVKVMASPRIATLNNQQAKIKQGETTYVQVTDSTGKANSIPVSADLELTVTPHINQNGTVSLKVSAKDNSFGTPPPGASTVSIKTREADSNMLLKNGETAVIGGIFRESESSAESGVPFLMDIPFIGHLFKSKGSEKSRQELLIFVTPRVLTDV